MSHPLQKLIEAYTPAVDARELEIIQATSDVIGGVPRHESLEPALLALLDALEGEDEDALDACEVAVMLAYRK